MKADAYTPAFYQKQAYVGGALLSISFFLLLLLVGVAHGLHCRLPTYGVIGKVNSALRVRLQADAGFGIRIIIVLGRLLKPLHLYLLPFPGSPTLQMGVA